MRKSRLAKKPRATTKTVEYQLKGGLNEITSPLSMKPGELYGVSNYEPGETNGYRRVGGYERLDGQHSPSEADYWIVNFDAGTTAILDGNEVVNVSGTPVQADMVGEVLFDAVVTSGSYATNDAAGYFYVTRTTDRVDPDFSDNDTLYVSAASICAANGAASKSGAATDSENATVIQNAMETLRARIQPLPGSGIVRGVWLFNGIRYGLRDNAGATACILFKSTTTGWSVVDLGSSMVVTGVTGTFVNGETITGGTSGTTALIVDVVGAKLYINTLSAGFTAAETITGGTSGATAAVPVAVPTTVLLPSGRYEFINENFYGATNLKGMYGVDGVNPGFMLTAFGFRQIPTGMVIDAPAHVEEYQKHLFYSFPGGSVQHSPTADPGNVWSPILGAAEIGTGDEVVGFVVLPKNSIGILNRNRTYVLSGNSIDNWNLDIYADESGAIEWSIQRMGNPVYFDDRGIIDFSTTLNYGDFENSSISEKIKKTLNANKQNVISSTRVKDKNQYRLFFNNNTFAICSFEDRKLSGFTLCEYPIPVECTCSNEDLDGKEILLFGSNNGYVYQADKGTNFDGGEITAFARLAFSFINKAEYNKEFLKAVFEIDSAEASTISFTPDFDYGERDDITQDISINASGGTWDVSRWDQFIYGDQLISNPVAYIDGQGQNIGITILSQHTYEPIHTINSVILHYINLGIKRD